MRTCETEAPDPAARERRPERSEAQERERELLYREAVRDALDVCMRRDESVFVMGLGVADPKRIFGTTTGLIEQYGKERVIEPPVSENAFTGVAIGAAISGMRPVVIHQRVDFSLMAMDQMVNNAAKWNYMFDGAASVPIVIRMMVGRGWGQGPQHSQSLHSLFAHIPGLKVVMPFSPYDAKGLLISSIEENNPVVFIEHRWLHEIRGLVPQGHYNVPIGKAKILQRGEDITLLAVSHAVLEALKAAIFLRTLGISAEVIDLRTVKPLDTELICESVRRTGRVLAVDDGHAFCGFAAELIAQVAETMFHSLKCPPGRLSSPDLPAPTSRALIGRYYRTASEIAERALDMVRKRSAHDCELLSALKEHEPQWPPDVPNLEFSGPF